MASKQRHGQLELLSTDVDLEPWCAVRCGGRISAMSANTCIVIIIIIILDPSTQFSGNEKITLYNTKKVQKSS